MACFCTLASGSSGNSCYIGSGVGGVLVDVGISYKAVLSALKSRDIDFGGIGGIFITHEHSDHIKGLKVLLKHLSAPLFATEEVLEYLAEKDYLPAGTKAYAMPEKGVAVGDMYVAAFDTPHDSVHSVGYVAVSKEGKKMAVSTDLGYVTPTVRDALANSDLVLIESNYDKSMLMVGRYPYYLKKRIDGMNGHLSNEDCAEFLPSLVLHGTQRVILGHLSTENNIPELALGAAAAALSMAGMKEEKDYALSVAPRYEPGEFIRI